MREFWSEFLEAVSSARAELGNPKTVWYRGHSGKEWGLLPTLYRLPSGIDGLAHEREAFLEFKRMATRLFDRRHSDWETLFDMQHYWVPTRLLDWSEVLGIAVAFILHNDYDQVQDSALFVLDPVGLNGLSGISEVKSIPDDSGFDYRAIYWDKKPFAPNHPIAASPPMQTDRVFAQRGVFTVHGNNPRALEDQCPQVVRRVVLKKEAKVAAREFLEHANLDEYSIYPDIVGMARHLRRKVFKC
ncbi:MAG: FRG domain-containing protein [Planctomycetota bacterium]|nr:MAG: FRG domain-containing protein [Planctomycetota bacterium]